MRPLEQPEFNVGQAVSLPKPVSLLVLPVSIVVQAFSPAIKGYRP